ncbi:uncharacterized protein LOC106096022 [Stomoxys calcitrans]|uniref:uncharacterized protein LOC106096022 n=1 Tax=Stomoxys calcitrans TaxID=35570 RepID=UPI0027E3AB5A|nr:uncharacterized protein LOC106096022 [Stomoxys calcitrans]
MRFHKSLPQIINTSICSITLLLLLFILDHRLCACAKTFRWELSQLHCAKGHIRVEILLLTSDSGEAPLLQQPHTHNNNISHLLPQSVYWQNIRIHHDDDPLERCQPLFNSKGFMFKIPLSDLYKCGFTQLVNKLSNDVIFYQNLVLEQPHRNQTFAIKCLYKKPDFAHQLKLKRSRRDVLPEDFQEDDDLDVIDTLQENAPEPQISMEVRQNGQLIDEMVTVIPGTPLIMEIKLNQQATNIYGMHTKYLEVSDGNATSETILFRGCTVDPYLFENFIVNPNNTLQAKFRAFKFPNTAFVKFRANIQICLKKCQSPHCLSGQGRSRRDLIDEKSHLYEASLGLFMKVDGWDIRKIDEIRKIEKHVQLLINNE